MRFVLALMLSLIVMPIGFARAQATEPETAEDQAIRGLIPKLQQVDLSSRTGIEGLIGQTLKPYGTPRPYIRQWSNYDGTISDPFAFYTVYTMAGPETRQSPQAEIRLGESQITFAEMRRTFPQMIRLPRPMNAQSTNDLLYELPGGTNRVLLLFSAQNGHLTNIFVHARPRVRVPNLFVAFDMSRLMEARIDWPSQPRGVTMLRADGTDEDRLERGIDRSGTRCVLSASDVATLVGILGRATASDRQVVSISNEVSIIFRLTNGGELLVMLTYANPRDPAVLVMPGGVLSTMSPQDAATLDAMVEACR